MKPVVDTIIEDLNERKAKGIATYGVPLTSFNGRNAIQDLKEEILDSLVYLQQLEEERKQLIDYVMEVVSSLNTSSDMRHKGLRLLKGMGENES